jgi:hypothetical protein
MDTIRSFLLFLDPVLIAAFRLPGAAWAGFLCGTFVLCLVCVLLGDLLALAASRLNRRLYGQQLSEMVHQHNLSVKAIGAGDKQSYTAVNKQAHEAFGKYFFSQTAIGMASLWPVPFALAWMDMRFRDAPLVLPVHMPLVGDSVPYLPVFILLYIAARVLYARVMRLLPAYRRLKAAVAHDTDTEQVLSFRDLDRPAGGGAGEKGGERWGKAR